MLDKFGKPACHTLLIGCAALQVNYVGKAANLYEDAGYKLHGSAYVINKYLGTTWLWDRVRVSGGAYGGFSDFDSHSGMFTYLSYRDPNLLKTVDNYDGMLVGSARHAAGCPVCHALHAQCMLASGPQTTF